MRTRANDWANETMSATTFVLMVLVGTSPAYSLGTFPDFQRCVEAGIGQVESLQPIEHRDLRWECIPQDR
jgi:hypothetical protein